MTRRGLLVFLVAGEPSGDALGAGLMAALRRAAPGPVAFAGVGGERMGAEGLESLFPMSDLSVMGLVEVLPRARRLLRRLRRTAAAARESRPDAVVTIDSPGFNLRLARRLRGSGAPLVHYVAPSVWAWRPGRARAMAALYDRVLALLPFEPPFFERAGLKCVHVGHPAAEPEGPAPDAAAFRARHGIPPEAPLLAALPGSRGGEVRRLLPVYLAAIRLLRARVPGLRLVAATTPAVAGAAAAAAWPIPPALVGDDEGRRAAFAAADAAIAASGTVTLELAAARTPMVVCYRVAPVTYAALRPLVKVDRYALANLVLGRRSVPELIQSRCTPKAVAREAERLLVDSAARTAQIAALARAVAALRGGGGASPSDRAARAVLDAIGERRDVGRRRVPDAAHHAPGEGPGRIDPVLHRGAGHDAPAPERLPRRPVHPRLRRLRPGGEPHGAGAHA